jgi:hypothetical protein
LSHGRGLVGADPWGKRQRDWAEIGVRECSHVVGSQSNSFLEVHRAMVLTRFVESDGLSFLSGLGAVKPTWEGVMSRIGAWLAALSGIVASLVAIQAGLAQVLPTPVQSFFNEAIRWAVETYLTSECNLSGNWVCSSDICQRPPERQASIKQTGYKLFFHNERNGSPDSAGIWVRPRLVFVPVYDPAHGGNFGEVAGNCRKITWSDTAVWDRQ